MNYFIENPVISFGLLVMIGLAVFMIAKVIDEIVLNRNLQLKQRQMRIKGIATGFTRRISILSGTALAPIVAVVLIVVLGTSNGLTPGGDIVRIKNASDIIDIYNDFNEKVEVNYSNWFFVEGGFRALALEAFSATDDLAEPEYDSVGGDYQGSDDYSDTNKQVIGVDEMDNVVTDGLYMFSIYDYELQISLAYTLAQEASALELLYTINYESDSCDTAAFYPQGLYVDDSYLVVIGNQYEYDCEEYYQYDCDYEVEDIICYPINGYYGWNNASHVMVKVYEKGNDFALVDEYRMNGNFTGTRKIGNDLYVVTNQFVPFYLEEELTMDAYLPRFEINGVETITAYEDIIYIEGAQPNSFTTFYGIDLDDKEVDMEVVLGDDGFNLYVSPENMYLVGTVYYFWPELDAISVDQPVRDYQTAIMKVNIHDGEVAYQTVGTVYGHTLNQFSMDEHDGDLRVTTTSGWWGEGINNRLYVLDENLEVKALIEGLGKVGESIKSTRFVGDYAYLVTFRQTDPFYVINLSDPENPFVEGELEIPGFSTYLQPLGEDYMLGIGFGDSSGGTWGFKVSIYDVSDKSNPTVFSEMTFDYEDFGWIHSSATYNHKDLLVDVNKGIIAMPFSSESWSDTYDEYRYNSGILVFHFDFETGLQTPDYVTHEVDTNYEVYVYKSKFISNYFYTISNKYIKVSTIEDPESILYSIQLRD